MRIRNLSRSLSESFTRRRPVSWSLIDAASVSSSLRGWSRVRCSVRYCRRARIRSSADACRSRPRSSRRDALRRCEPLSLSWPSEPRGGARDSPSDDSSRVPSSRLGRRSRRLLDVSLGSSGYPKSQYSPKRTCARYVDQPGIDAVGVELVVAGKHPHILAHVEVLGADGAAEVLVVCLRAVSDGP